MSSLSGIEYQQFTSAIEACSSSFGDYPTLLLSMPHK
jgi:hypothetical protein